MEDFDTIVNWSNKLGNSYNAKHIQASAECQSLKNKGFNRDEAEEILAGNGFGLKGLKEVLDSVFGELKSKKYAKREAFFVPTSYDDVMHVVEHNLFHDGPEVFVNDLTNSEFPIIEASKSHKQNLLKLAKTCFENASLMKHIHAELKPYFEEIMLNSVLEAEQKQCFIKKAGTKYEVKVGNKKAIVNLMEGTSNNEVFNKGNYAKFGLADEFLVSAHDKVSPYTRILRALSD